MSQAQYDAILDMSMNNGIKHPFETVKAELSTQNAEDDSLKPFVLLVVEQKGEGLKAAEELLQNKCKPCDY